MTTTVASILSRVRVTLQDVDADRWPDSELVGYLNEAQQALVVARPDVNAATESIAMVQGARQTIPSTSIALIDVPRNSTGRKRAIRRVDLQTLDAVSRDWQSSTEATEFVNFAHDLREPRVFYVYPPSKAAGASVDVTTSKYPTQVTAVGTIALEDQWATPLGDFVLSRAYSKDAEFGGNANAAAGFMSAFNSAIGVQLQAATAVSLKA